MLSLFLTAAIPAHSRCNLQERRLDPPGGRRYIPHRSERLEGREERPDEAPETTGGGNTERTETVRPGGRQGREAARSLGRVGSPGSGRVARPDPATRLGRSQ